MPNVHQLPKISKIKLSIGHKNIENNLSFLVLHSLNFYKNLIGQKGTIKYVDFGYNKRKKTINCDTIVTLRRANMYDFLFYLLYAFLPNIEKKRINVGESLIANKITINIKDLKTFYNLPSLYLKSNFTTNVTIEFNEPCAKIIKFLYTKLKKF